VEVHARRRRGRLVPRHRRRRGRVGGLVPGGGRRRRGRI
jgi:hypothetical protein